MSTVRDYYKDHRSWNDDLHKLLDKEPGLLAQLPGLRARALACCGAVAGKGGVIELVVADPVGWDVIAAEQAAIQAKLDAIETMVQKLDSIFDEMVTEGADVPGDKTVRALWLAESARRTPGEKLDYGASWNGKTHAPSTSDPQYLTWAEAGERALREAEAALKA